MPFVPLDDDTPRIRIHLPWVSWAIIALCMALFLWETYLSDEDLQVLLHNVGMTPAVLLGQALPLTGEPFVPPLATLITYAFFHGSNLHLIGNLLFLWVFGDNVEDAMGHGRFLLFFLLCGALAALVLVVWDTASIKPTIGASGAISGVLGAYLLLHPKAKVLIPIYFIPVHLPAWLLLFVWVGYQFFALFTDPGTGTMTTAWSAHIGGFAAGLLLVIPMRHNTVPLLGTADLPSGITIRDKIRWDSRNRNR